MQKTTKSELFEALKEYGVLTKKDLPVIFNEYGVVTKKDLRAEISASESRTDLKLNKLERSLTIKITKSKNDLAERIANVAIAKEERSKVERIDKRVTTLENFQFT